MNPPAKAMSLRSAARLLLLVVLTVAASCQTSAQNYAVDRFVTGGGGGTSTNAQFSVSGTIGQPEASAPLMGGRFAVEGGFWHEAIVIPNAGAPTPNLMLLKASGTLFFSWPLSAVDFVLETSPVVGPSAVWSPVNATVQTGAQYRYVLLRPQHGIQFYRLRQVTVAQ